MSVKNGKSGRAKKVIAQRKVVDRCYVMTDEELVSQGVTLYCVKATRSFSYVKEGDLGGWIEKLSNLGPDAWVDENAKVYGEAKVVGGALFLGNAQVYGPAIWDDAAVVTENAKVFDRATVTGKAKIYGDAQIRDCGRVHDAAA